MPCCRRLPGCLDHLHGSRPCVAQGIELPVFCTFGDEKLGQRINYFPLSEHLALEVNASAGYTITFARDDDVIPAPFRLNRRPTRVRSVLRPLREIKEVLCRNLQRGLLARNRLRKQMLRRQDVRLRLLHIVPLLVESCGCDLLGSFGLTRLLQGLLLQG